jgi:hypothetical protein
VSFATLARVSELPHEPGVPAPEAPGCRPLHRVVGRGLVIGLVGAPIVTLVTLPFSACAFYRGEVLLAALAIGLAVLLGAPIVGLAIEAAARVRPRRRPAVLLLAGATATVLVSFLVAWIFFVIEVGPERAPDRLVRDVLGWWRANPGTVVADGLVVACVVMGLGLPRASGWRRPMRLGAAAAGAALAWGAAAALAALGTAPQFEPADLWDVPGALLAVALSLGVAFEAGDAVDDEVVRRWRARRDEAARTS